MEKPMFRLGLDALKVRSENDRTFLADAFFPDVRIAKYSKNAIRVGTIFGEDETLYDKSDYKVFSLDVATSDITLLIGLRGSGKTFAMRSLASRAFKSGFAVVYFDIKGEMASNVFPVQESILKKSRLAKDEHPEAIPTTMCIPYFLRKTYHGKEPEAIFFQFSLNDVSEDDLLYVLKPANDNYKNAILLAHNLIRKKKIKTIEQLRAFLLEKVNPQTARSVSLSIDTLVEHKIFGDDYPLDILHVLNTSILAFDIKNYEDFDKTGGFVHLYASMLLYKIMAMRSEGNETLKKMVDVYIDEFYTFCPADSNTYSKTAIIYMIDKYRKRGVGGKFCAQNIKQVPDKEVLDSVRNIFIPSTIKGGKDSALEQILRKFNHWGYAWDERRKWHDILANMKRYTWMYIDAFNHHSPVKLMRFYAPLCAHEEETRT